MAVDAEASTSTTTETAPEAAPSTTTTSASAAASSSAAKKKEEEQRAEREKKYGPPGQQRAGVVLAAEKKVTSKLLEKEKGSSEKLFLVNGSVLSSAYALGEKQAILTLLLNLFYRNVISGVAGYNADANSLVSYARNAAQVSQLLRRMSTCRC